MVPIWCRDGDEIVPRWFGGRGRRRDLGGAGVRGLMGFGVEAVGLWLVQGYGLIGYKGALTDRARGAGQPTCLGFLIRQPNGAGNRFGPAARCANTA